MLIKIPMINLLLLKKLTLNKILNLIFKEIQIIKIEISQLIIIINMTKNQKTKTNFVINMLFL